MDNRLELLLLVFLSLPCASWRVLLSKAHPFLQVRVGDVEHLQVGVHRLLHHLLEGLLLLLSLLLVGLPGGVGAGGTKQLHVGVHQLLDHLLGVVLLLLDLLGELLHLAKPFPGTFRCLQSSVTALAHRSLLPYLSLCGWLMYPLWGDRNPLMSRFAG